MILLIIGTLIVVGIVGALLFGSIGAGVGWVLALVVAVLWEWFAPEGWRKIGIHRE